MASNNDYVTKKRIWQAYNSNISLGSIIVALLVVMIVNLGFNYVGSENVFLDKVNNYLSYGELGIAIVANVYNAKLKYSYIASILVYIMVVIAIPAAVSIVIMTISENTITDDTAVTMGMIVLFSAIVVIALEVISAIFSFRTANKIKKDFPNMRQDYIDARKSRNK